MKKKSRKKDKKKDKRKNKKGKIGFNYPEKGEFLYLIKDLNGADAEKMLLIALRLDMHIIKDAILDIQKDLHNLR